MRQQETLFNELNKIKKHRTTAPTFSPRTFLDQVQLFDDGTNRRVYYYINGAWRYSTLT